MFLYLPTDATLVAPLQVRFADAYAKRTGFSCGPVRSPSKGWQWVGLFDSAPQVTIEIPCRLVSDPAC